MRVLLTLALASSLAGCGDGSSSSSFGGVTQANVSTASAGSAESTAAGSSSSSTGDGVVWDMGMPDFGPVQPAGCEGKIDFLFVISTSSLMKDDQEGLIASVPGFIDAIGEQLTDFDVHVLVANTDKSWALASCDDCTDSCDPQGFPPYCGAEFTACDKKIGAGVTFPTGEHASNRRCAIEGGSRYITGGQQNLDDVFACIAQVGVDGSGITGETMVAALQPKINDPDDEYACNGGFLREDALLVVTLIQDTYDSDSLGTADDWIAALRMAKHDDDDAFMVLVLTTDVDLGYMQHCLPNEYNPNPNRLRTLGDGVEHGFVGSICMPGGYGDWFNERVTYLVDLCENFVPPG
jgi:hypothetical protein